MAAPPNSAVIDLEANALSPTSADRLGTQHYPIEIEDDEHDAETNSKTESIEKSSTEPVTASSYSVVDGLPSSYDDPDEELELPKCEEALALLLVVVSSSKEDILELQRIFRPILHKHDDSPGCPIVLSVDGSSQASPAPSENDDSAIRLPASEEARELFMRLVFSDFEEIEQLKKLYSSLPDPSTVQLPPMALPLPKPVAKVSARNPMNRSPIRRQVRFSSSSPQTSPISSQPLPRSISSASTRTIGRRTRRAQARPAALQSHLFTPSDSTVDISSSDARNLPSRDAMFRNRRRVTTSTLDDSLCGLLRRNRVAREHTKASKPKDITSILRLGDESVADWTPSAARLLVWSNQIDQAHDDDSRLEENGN